MIRYNKQFARVPALNSAQLRTPPHLPSHAPVPVEETVKLGDNEDVAELLGVPVEVIVSDTDDEGDSEGDTDVVDVALLDIVADIVPVMLALHDGLNVALNVTVDDTEPVLELLTLDVGLSLALELGELLALRDGLTVAAQDKHNRDKTDRR